MPVIYRKQHFKQDGQNSGISPSPMGTMPSEGILSEKEPAFEKKLSTEIIQINNQKVSNQILRVSQKGRPPRSLRPIAYANNSGKQSIYSQNRPQHSQSQYSKYAIQTENQAPMENFIEFYESELTKTQHHKMKSKAENDNIMRTQK